MLEFFVTDTAALSRLQTWKGWFFVGLTAALLYFFISRQGDLGVNAYVVKPVEFNQFVDVLKTLGMFWIAFNEPPP